MRPYLVTSFVGHFAVLVLGAVLAEALHEPVSIQSSLDVALVSPVEAQQIEETPPPPAEVERPEPEVVPEEASPVEPEPEPEPKPEVTEAEVPPPPEELERPQRDLVPDDVPEDVEPVEEFPDLTQPDPDLPPPPPVDDLPEPPPVQSIAREDSQAASRSEPAVVDATTPPAEAEEEAVDVEELGSGRAVGADSSSGIDDGYLKRVRRKIGRLWQPTPASALGQSRVVTIVSFRIRADGQIQSPAVSDPSGLTVFDRQALRAVIDASPLPALPPRFGDGIAINFRFEYVR